MAQEASADEQCTAAKFAESKRMITEGSQNMEFGQFQEVRYNCLEDIRFRIGDKYVYI